MRGSSIVSNTRLRLASINYRSWVKPIIEDVGRDIERSALSMGLQPSGVIRLPTKTRRWSVLRSPFVHKKAFDQAHPLATRFPRAPTASARARRDRHAVQ